MGTTSGLQQRQKNCGWKTTTATMTNVTISLRLHRDQMDQSSVIAALTPHQSHVVSSISKMMTLLICQSAVATVTVTTVASLILIMGAMPTMISTVTMRACLAFWVGERLEWRIQDASYAFSQLSIEDVSIALSVEPSQHGPLTMARQKMLWLVRFSTTLRKFGFQFLRGVKQAFELDCINGNNLWKEALEKEMGLSCMV